MPTRNVDLTEHEADFIRQRVASGDYQDENEVLREGLRLLEERNDDRAQKISVLREKLDAAAAEGLSQRTPEEIWASVESRQSDA